MLDSLSLSQQSLSRKYLIYSFLTELYFQSAVWLYFYRIFMSDYQLGILDGITFAIGLIAEVPSGVLADVFGRAKIARYGHLMNGVGLLLLGAASSQIQFLAAMIFHVIGAAFVSGADQALFFDKLEFEPDSLHWRRLVTRGAQVGLISSVMATIIGGLLHTLNPRLPYLLSGLSFLGAYGLLRLIHDTPLAPPDVRPLSKLRYQTSEISQGFRAFFSPPLLMYIPIIVTVQGLFYAADWGMLRVILLDRFHFDPITGAFALASIRLITVAILHFMHHFADHITERGLFVVVSVTAAISLLISIPNIGNWGFIIIFALYAGDLILCPIMSESINAQVKPENRATMLSVASFFKNLTYVLLAPILGYLNLNYSLNIFLLVWPILIVVALIVYLRSSSAPRQF